MVACPIGGGGVETQQEVAQPGPKRGTEEGDSSGAKKVRSEVGHGTKRSQNEKDDDDRKRGRIQGPDGSMLIGQLINAMKEVDVSEIYSPKRVTSVALRFGLKASEAFDLTNGWDLSKKENQTYVEEYIERVKPLVVIGRPMCTMFSALQTLSKWNQEKDMKIKEAEKHIELCAKIYEKTSFGRKDLFT